MSEKTGRPELGTLKAGDRVYIQPSMNSRRRAGVMEYREAEVVKVARVWVTMRSLIMGWPQEYRMRLDTQDEGTESFGSNASFVTPEQREWDEAREFGLAYLREQGISLERSSLWIEREAELAEIIRRGRDAIGTSGT